MKELDRTPAPRRRHTLEAGALAAIAAVAVLIGVAGVATHRGQGEASAGQAAVSWLRFVNLQVDSGSAPVRLDFEAPTAGHARLDVRDSGGRRVAIVLDEDVVGGYHRVSWDGLDARGGRILPGVYSARLELGGESVVTELIVL